MGVLDKGATPTPTSISTRLSVVDEIPRVPSPCSRANRYAQYCRRTPHLAIGNVIVVATGIDTRNGHHSGPRMEDFGSCSYHVKGESKAIRPRNFRLALFGLEQTGV